MEEDIMSTNKLILVWMTLAALLIAIAFIIIDYRTSYKDQCKSRGGVVIKISSELRCIKKEALINLENN